MKNLWLEVSVLCILVFILGICIANLYNSYHPFTIQNITYIERCSTQVQIAGLWLSDLSQLKNYDGDWICINIRSVTNLKDLETVCRHEISHEIFSLYCGTSEEHFDRCVNVTIGGT